jgi:hypothetical protein
MTAVEELRPSSGDVPSCDITVVLPYAGKTHPATTATTIAARVVR